MKGREPVEQQGKDSMSAFSWPVFLGFTILLMGWIAFMTGQALASTWRPWWQVVPYAVMLGLVDRFFVYALFEGELLSETGIMIDTIWLVGVGLVVHRITLVRKMTCQYPWLYARHGLLSWRERGH